MARSIKAISALLAFAAFAGNVWAQGAAPDANMADVQKALEKAGVKDVAQIPVLPVQAVAMFKVASEGKDAQAIQKAYEDAGGKNTVSGGGSSPTGSH